MVPLDGAAIQRIKLPAAPPMFDLQLSTFDVFVREEVARLWEECLVSQKKYVLVLGNPGIGKSYSMLYLLRLLLLMPLQAPAAAHGADAMTAVPSDEMPASSTMMAVDTDAARGGAFPAELLPRTAHVGVALRLALLPALPPRLASAPTRPSSGKPGRIWSLPVVKMHVGGSSVPRRRSTRCTSRRPRSYFTM
jgi:hypothetical protein